MLSSLVVVSYECVPRVNRPQGRSRDKPGNGASATIAPIAGARQVYPPITETSGTANYVLSLDIFRDPANNVDYFVANDAARGFRKRP